MPARIFEMSVTVSRKCLIQLIPQLIHLLLIRHRLLIRTLYLLVMYLRIRLHRKLCQIRLLRLSPAKISGGIATAAVRRSRTVLFCKVKEIVIVVVTGWCRMPYCCRWHDVATLSRAGSQGVEAENLLGGLEFASSILPEQFTIVDSSHWNVGIRFARCIFGSIEEKLYATLYVFRHSKML